MIYIDREGGQWASVEVKSGTRLVSTDWLAPHRPQPDSDHPLRAGTALCTVDEVESALGPLRTDDLPPPAPQSPREPR